MGRCLNTIFVIVTLFFAIPAESQVRIGVITDLSGVMAFQGRQTQLGAVLAADEIRAGGGQVDLLIEDHQMQTKNAVSAMQKLLSLNGVSAVFSEFTPTSVAIAPLAKANSILFIYSGGGTSIIGEYPEAFKTHLDFDSACRKLIAALKPQSPAIGMLTANIESAERCREGAAASDPALVAVAYDPGQDVGSQILQLRSKGAKAIINVGYEADQARMLKSLRTLQFFPILGSLENNFSSETIAQWRDLLKQMTVVAFPPVSADFVGRIKMHDPSNNLAAVSSAALAYLHVKQLYRAAAACPGADLKCQVREVEQSGPDPVMDFTGWQRHVAQFDLHIKPLIVD